MPGTKAKEAPRRKGEERRKHTRATAHLLASTKEQSTGITGYGRITNVSLGGVYILTTDPCPPRQKVSIQFKIPGSGAMVAAETVVRRVHPGEGMGLEFEALTAEQGKALLDYIKSENS